MAWAWTAYLAFRVVSPLRRLRSPRRYLLRRRRRCSRTRAAAARAVPQATIEYIRGRCQGMSRTSMTGSCLRDLSSTTGTLLEGRTALPRQAVLAQCRTARIRTRTLLPLTRTLTRMRILTPTRIRIRTRIRFRRRRQYITRIRTRSARLGTDGPARRPRPGRHTAYPARTPLRQSATAAGTGTPLRRR